MTSVPVKTWTDRLAAVLREVGGPLDRVVVVRETTSTQDAARRLDAAPGTVLIACRQTGGRGRLGRVWADTADEGIAASFVCAAAAPQRLAVTCAVAAARAAESLLGRPVGIKWPNDIVADGRKLAGILIEQSGNRAVIGIGMNVLQTRWSPELADRAVSLAQLGAPCDRLVVAAALLRTMSETLPWGDDRVGEEFARRDVLVETRAAFRCDRRTITGTVVKVDPMRGLLVRSDREEIYLPAATTAVVG